ncbi:MAG: aminotransferase class III-fold pyridoxal phosphate-dependent enzyme [Deltaproteobacteria bacterium]|nr:aminotransferase class III-fold pyridoxal phosphate-dependent enzyme [Deltaproteobacteria bacterium]
MKRRAVEDADSRVRVGRGGFQGEEAVPQAELARIYQEYARPDLVKLLAALKLDKTFERGQGDCLYYRDDTGVEHEVLDFVGGFGTTFFGHNHPALVAQLRETIDAGRPQNAQGSIRSAAARLARRLSEVAERETGRAFVVSFANSGTEANEIAIKHAALELAERLDEVLEDAHREHVLLARRIAAHPRDLKADAVERVAGELAQPQIERLGDLIDWIDAANREAARTAPVFVCVEGAFHGKTTGALKLTYNKEYRMPNANLGIRSVFIDPQDASQVDREIGRNRRTFRKVSLGETGHLRIVERDVSLVAGFFVEAIQGEGGVVVLPTAFLEVLRRRATELGIPVVVDEVQSGMGRTGTFFAATGSNFVGDYYTMSKALGGGLGKVAACLIDRTRFRGAFSLMHTSTFAEDDWSCEVALAAVEMITADGGRLMRVAAEKGAAFRAKLEALAARFPDVVREVRGRGLMLGLELREIRADQGGLMWHADLTGNFGYAVCAYLLNAEGIRVLPTLSEPRTLRFEPSVFVEERDVDRVIGALERVCKMIRAGHSVGLIAFQVGRNESRSEFPSVVESMRDRLVEAPHPRAMRVGFLGHFVDSEHLSWWDPALAELNTAERAELLDRIEPIAEPAVLEQINVTSDTGDIVHFNFIGLPIGPMQIGRDMMESQGRRFRELIAQGIEVAKLAGCRVLGFGGYTSIATRNCTDIVDDAIAVTTGNSLTVAMGLQAMRETAAETGVALHTANFAAVGATGNICSTYAVMLAPQLASVTLIGRNVDDPRLLRVAAQVTGAAYEDLVRPQRRKRERGGTGQRKRGGLVEAIAASRAFKAMAGRPPGAETGTALFEALCAEMGDACPVRIAGRIDALRDANLIVCASNSLTTLVGPEHLARDRAVVVCDISTPADVSSEAARLDNVTVMLGGIVKVPGRADFHVRGLPLQHGEAYACMSETMLIGLTGITENFSVGHISPHQVRKIAQLANLHGFALSQAKWDRSF